MSQKRSRKTMKWSALGAAILGLATIPPTGDPPPGYAAPLLDRPAALDSWWGTDCGWCAQAGCEAEMGHTFRSDFSSNNGTERAWQEHHPDDCFPAFCGDAHPPTGCQSEEDVLPLDQQVELWDALVKAAPSDLRQLVETAGSSVSYNADRNAIQVRGCRDVIVMNMPLSGEEGVPFSN